ncbi:MAG TPA: hypothetical protein VGC79_27260 [Polyangiaceae bacterium]
MARAQSQRLFAVWCAGGLLVWSCSSQPGPGAGEGTGGHSAGSGGASAGTGGSLPALGGAGSGPGAGTAGLSVSGGGGASQAGASASGGKSGLGSEAEGGAAGLHEADGGAAGSSDSSTFDARCGLGWAAGGSAALPELAGSVTPKVDSTGNWSFTFGRYRFVVAGAHGARIIEFSIDDNNLIDATGGSTFWPSPQEAYTWPPPTEIDSAAYLAKSDATSVTLTSETATLTGGNAAGAKLSVRKRFSVNAASGVVSIEYQLTNDGSSSASWAPWEVTRVRAGGYTFAPKGPGNRSIMQDSFQKPLSLSLLPPAPAANGIEWLNYPSLTLTQDNYIAEFDGAEGWLAHANRFGKDLLPALLVKSFVDAPDASLPTNQAEIQLWTSGTANPKLIEVEEQGAQQMISPGAALSWTVHWSACELPSSLVLSAGSVELAALARAHAIKP